jgi:arabinose-5-phosphate isomerase
MTNQASDADSERLLGVARRVLSIEADALSTLAASLGSDFVRCVEILLATEGRVICVGVGKSGHIARKIAATLSSTGAPALFIHPTEASHGDLGAIRKGDSILVLSRSGETSELSDIVHFARRFGAPLIAMTAARGSTLGRAADVALLLPPAPEACSETQAPTTSTTMMIALGDALAVALLQRRGFDASAFKIFHPAGALGAMLKTASDVMRTGAAQPLVATGSKLADAIAEIGAKRLGCVGVVDGRGKLIGIVTDGDLRRLLASGRAAGTVDEAMTRGPVTVRPDALAGAVLALMNERAITQVFVVDDGAPVGIAHLHDLLRAGLA